VTITGLAQGAAAVCQSEGGAYSLCVGEGESTEPPPQSGVLRGFTVSGELRGLLLVGTRGLRIEQVRVDAVGEVGIGARSAATLVLSNVQVAKTRASARAPGLGVGLVLLEGSRAEVSQTLITESAAQGAYVSESSVQLDSSVVEKSGFIGVLLDCRKDARCKDSLASELRSVSIDLSGGVGLAVRGARLAVRDSDIGNTALTKGYARNLEIQGGALVDLSGNRIHHSAGQGVVLDGSSGTLGKNVIEENAERGLWLQNVPAAPGVVLTDNQILSCGKVGLGATAAKGIKISGGRIAGTRKVNDLESNSVIGDGIQVLGQSELEVAGAELAGNERVGLLIDGAKAAVSETSISGGEAALVVQNAVLADQRLTNNRGASGEAVSATVPATPYAVNAKPIELLSTDPIPMP
jgi:hypothetical protein